jgi:hypothetical protein
MKSIKAGVIYFGLVFGAGFALGVIRTLWVVPRLGTRNAELMEAPIMLLISFLAARRVIRLAALPYRISARLGMGCLSLFLMLVAEFGFVLWLRGLTIGEYLRTRDPISGTAYYVSLGVFAIMPILVERTSSHCVMRLTDKTGHAHFN